MAVGRRRRLLGATIAALLGVQAVVAINATAQDPQTQQIPLTVWNMQGAAALDGIGSIIAFNNVPAPTPGQSTETSWQYAHAFKFVGDPQPFGVIALDIEGTDKFATLAVNDGTEVVDSARFPFEWVAGRFYLPLAFFLPGNVIAGVVYDFTTEEYTFIGVVRVDPAWGRIHPESATYLLWFGTPLDDCALYPYTDHFRYKPLGVVYGDPAVKVSAPVGNAVVDGDCPATVTNEPDPDWRRYQAGSATGPTTTTTSIATTTTTSSTTTTVDGTTTTTNGATTTTTNGATTTTLISITTTSIDLTTTLPDLLTTTTTNGATTTTAGG